MRPLYGLILSVTTVVAVYLYTVLNTMQLLDVIKHQPGCFPPFLLSGTADPQLTLPTCSLTGADDGVRSHGYAQRSRTTLDPIGETDG